MAGILDLFVPKEKKFFDMLKDLSAKTHEGTKLFLKFIHDYEKLSPSEMTAMVDELKRTELSCDDVTHNVAIELNKTFLTPIDREDIHRLSTLIDDVMDITYNVSHKLLLYDIKTIPKYMPELAATAADCSEEINKLISNIGERNNVGPHLKKVHELEKKADSLRNEAFAYLFRDSLSAIEVVKLKDLYEWLEAICDKCEDIADVVEGIVIKYA